VKVEDDEDEIGPALDDQTVTVIAKATATAPTDPRPSKKREKLTCDNIIISSE
jgi:hypothetical protein